jgi:hypothetical protein
MRSLGQTAALGAVKLAASGGEVAASSVDRSISESLLSCL